MGRVSAFVAVNVASTVKNRVDGVTRDAASLVC
jgi:hypothetical protein